MRYVLHCCSRSLPFRVLHVPLCPPQWLTEHRSETEASHDLSVGLRENYRARWKTAINAVRASTKFRTFAALAADNKTGEGGKKTDDAEPDAKRGISPPSMGELYSDGSLDEGEGNAEYHTGEEEEEEEEVGGKKSSGVSYLADKLKSSNVH